MNATLPAVLELASAPALVVRPWAGAAELASALLEAAQMTLPLSAASIQAWWDQAPLGERIYLVRALARALPHAEGVAGTRLADPGWRYNAGVPLALATFVVAMRLKRRHRAENTLRAWRGDWRIWRAWCKRNGRPSFNPSAAQLSEFFAWYAPTHKVATIRRLGATLTAMHQAAGFRDPLSQPLHSEIWRDALTPPMAKERKEREKKRKTKGRKIPTDRRDEPVDQAEGLRRETLDAVLKAIDTTKRIGARDAALLCAMYDMLGRRSEVVALTVRDIATDRVTTSGTALVRRSKTDQTGEGRILYLRPDTLSRLQHWLALSGIKEGPIFRALRGFAGRYKAVDLPPLDAAELARILRRRVGAVLKKPDGTPQDVVKLFSGHSCRVGAAQDMAENGATDLEIMLAGRWTSVAMVARYTAKIRAKQGFMARLAEKQDAEGPIINENAK